MGAVHRKNRAVEQVKDGAGLTPHRVDPVGVVPAPAVKQIPLRSQVLDQRAPQSHVEKLKAPADAQHRLFGVQKRLQNGKLRPVPVQIHLLGPLHPLSVVGRVDILPAAEDQPVTFRRQRGVGAIAEHRLGPHPHHGIDIVGAVGFQPGNQDLFHGTASFSLFVQYIIFAPPWQEAERGKSEKPAFSLSPVDVLSVS